MKTRKTTNVCKPPSQRTCSRSIEEMTSVTRASTEASVLLTVSSTCYREEIGEGYTPAHFDKKTETRDATEREKQSPSNRMFLVNRRKYHERKVKELSSQQGTMEVKKKTTCNRALDGGECVFIKRQNSCRPPEPRGRNTVTLFSGKPKQNRQTLSPNQHTLLFHQVPPKLAHRLNPLKNPQSVHPSTVPPHEWGRGPARRGPCSGW